MLSRVLTPRQRRNARHRAGHILGPAVPPGTARQTVDATPTLRGTRSAWLRRHSTPHTAQRTRAGAQRDAVKNAPREQGS
jgi:hypothetical protein